MKLLKGTPSGEDIRGKRLSTAQRTKIKRKKYKKYLAEGGDKNSTRTRYQGSLDKEKYSGAPDPKFYRMSYASKKK
jgi:hypothetical protein